MIKSFKHATIIYTNHGANPIITTKTKFSTTNIDKLNMKLIKISIYLSQFRLNVRHRSEKSNVISNALNRLFNKTSKKKQFEYKCRRSENRQNVCIRPYFDEKIHRISKNAVE